MTVNAGAWQIEMPKKVNAGNVESNYPFDFDKVIRADSQAKSKEVVQALQPVIEKFCQVRGF
jgi:hypothetical protein